MDLLFTHKQEKIEKKSNSNSSCDLKFFYDGTSIIYTSTFHFVYHRYNNKKNVTFEHSFTLNVSNGDIQTTYAIINEGLTDERMFRTHKKNKKNDFKMLSETIENGLYRGEKRIGYWGVKYNRATDHIVNLIKNIIDPKFKLKWDKDKSIQGVNELYDTMVDYHLDCKGIKGHDGVYFDIQNDYPKKKWLEKNDFKFLPSVLDSYGIKSKYLIGEINKNTCRSINISSLNYICKLFGENYLEYIKQIKWSNHCTEIPPNKKTHELKNDAEKKSMVNIINKWETDSLKSDSLIYLVNKLLSIRELLEKRNVNLKFKGKNDSDFDNLMEVWSGIKFHFARGYRVKYTMSDEFVDFIEKDIIVGGEVFKPKILLSEDEFRMEGYEMKNCMSKQFPHGAIYIFVSMQHKNKRINLQYRKGNLVQSYGKANTPVMDVFNEPTEILTQRFKSNPNIEWKKEKYDFLMH